MPSVSALIKPVSGACDLNCSYCFYRDELTKCSVKNRGKMSMSLFEICMERLLEAAGNDCKALVSVAFQGGEPTLAGLDFYRSAVEFSKRVNKNRIPINFSIQTNGCSITAEWANFFYKEKFLVGLSLDGTSEFHDANRTFPDRSGSFSRVMHTAGLLRSSGASFNILTVLTDSNARHITKIYNFYKKNGFMWMQFIPCLAPLNSKNGSLSSEMWLTAHKRLFDLWFIDFKEYLKSGTEVPSVRYFDNLILAVAGRPTEMCGFFKPCTLQYVIEADGGVYPCDFYAIDEYRMGNISDNTLDSLAKSDAAKAFLRESNKCCCRRYHNDGIYIYEDAEKEFLKYAGDRLEFAARRINTI
jgi:uncharacterized protein